MEDIECKKCQEAIKQEPTARLTYGGKIIVSVICGKCDTEHYAIIDQSDLTTEE